MNKDAFEEKESKQEALYSFPYHHLASLEEDQTPTLYREFASGLQYLTYITFACRKVLSLSPENLLDVGCGDGYLLKLIGESVPHAAGADTSSSALAFARGFVPYAEFIHGTAQDVEGTFDVVTCIETLEHIPDASLPVFIAGLHERTRTGGRLIVSVPTEVLPLSTKHWRHYTLDLLKAHLGHQFEMEESQFLVRSSVMTKLLNRALVNRYFAIRLAWWRRLIWRLWFRNCYYASSSNGQHLVAVLRAK